MSEKFVPAIDGEATNRKRQGALLKTGGFQIQEAADNEAGHNKTLAHPPDPILMDIKLPGLDGLSVTPKLKADSHLKNIPIICLRGMAEKERVKQAIESGCAGFIPKPFEKNRFLETVSRGYTCPE